MSSPVTNVSADTVRALIAGEAKRSAQPISSVVWLDPDELSANSWNPNRQAPPEYRLLKLSIIETGWTQPIVAREHEGGLRLEIVDGFHRWKAFREDPELQAMTDGMVPVVVLPETNDDDARLATVRHNRARGTHHVLRMADLVADLLDGGMDAGELGRRLGMDSEEVERLADRGRMTKRGSGEDFGKGWTV